MNDSRARDMNELESSKYYSRPGSHLSFVPRSGASVYRGIGIGSTICSLLLINEAQCYSVLGSSDQALEGGNPRSRAARWRPT